MNGWLTEKSPLNLYRDDLREALGRSGRTLAAMRRACNEYGAGVLATEDERTWVWSDLHIGHRNILWLGGGRPFDSLAEMDTALWDVWYSTVGRDDTLVCVGDFAMGPGRTGATWEKVRSAPGRSVLVIGNHDLGRQGTLMVHGFDRVAALLTTPGDPPLIWTHLPLPNVPEGHVNVHGHQHHTPPTVGTPHINVCVEQLEYRPILMDRLRRLARRLVAGDILGGDTTLERVRLVEG